MRIVPAPRPAFTLIELLVVIAIVGVLTGLLLTAVQKVRGSAQRLACRNNLRQIGLALHQYHDARNHLPPARILGPFDALGIRGKVEHSWSVFILPYIEQENLATAYRFDVDFRDPANRMVTETPLKVMVCPAAPQRQADVFASGGFHWSAAVGDYVPIMRVDDPLAALGLIDPADDLRGILTSNGLTTFQDVRDGLSNTIMIAEAAGRPQLWRNGKHIPGIRVRGAGWADSRSAFSINGCTPDGLTSPGPCPLNVTNDREMYSFHSHGVNVLFGDGSVHFLASDTPMNVVGRLITRSGGEPPLDQPASNPR